MTYKMSSYSRWVRNISSPSERPGEAYSFIGGGQNNCICAGVNHGSIFGGSGNTVSGSCSAILGGSGNNDGGFPFIGMYGNGLVATVAPATYGAPSAFWVDSVVTPRTPVDTVPGGGAVFAALPQGALYTNVALGSGFLASQVYIK